MDAHKENYYDPNIAKRKRNYQKFENPVVDTFIDICKKLDYSSRDYLKMVIPIEESKESLQFTDQIIILNYLKQIAIYLIKSKLELEDKLCTSTDAKQYEAELQTMEADIRQHIRVQQQLQIFVEQAQQKINEFESEKLKSEQLINDLTLKLQAKEQELNELRFKGNQKAPFQATKTEPIQSSIDHLDNLQMFTLVENSPTKNNFTQVQGAIRKGRNQQLSKEPLKPKGDNTPQQSKCQAVESPEKIARKFSQPNYMEINALRQLIKKPWQCEFVRQSTVKFQKQQSRGSAEEELIIYLFMNSTKSEILYAGFNQDSSMFCVGTDTGFRVCNALNSTEKFQRDLKGGVGHVEMLYRSNILALVGGGLQPKYPENKVIIWDDHLVKCIGEMSFRTKIKNVKLKNDRVVVVLEKKIFVYNFTDLKLLDQIETCPNPRGICTINTDGDHTILATLEKSVGKVFVNNYDLGKAYCIEAHVSPISYLQLNAQGTKLATSSEKGTVIRIYDTSTGQISQELRRGNDYATITSLAFDYRSNWLGCASDQGTIHIFAVKQEQQEQSQPSHNPKSKFEFLKGFIPILGSEWSFAQFRVLDTKCKVSFVPDENQLIVISYEGKYYKAQFDPQKGGECIKVEEKTLISEKL